ncbi:hypothetical protein [Thermococcus sp.]|uniref:hypothetical protein n=1 Tax=Thermococcus sp. TaxID=35749 RepID=UPI00262D17A8|nr:hypothetical protein [Thermococcus sp.]
MPVGPNLYVDGISVRSLIVKAKAQSTTAQAQSSTSQQLAKSQQPTRSPPRGKIYIDGVWDASVGPQEKASTTGGWSKTQQPQTTQKQFDVTLRDLEEGRGQNIFTADNAQDVDISPPAQPQLFTLDQDRTLTYNELKELPDQKPAYYDPKTQTAYTGLGVFLAGMGSLVRNEIDPLKLDPLAKAEYYAGRAAAEVGLSYGLGTILGDALGRAPELVNILGKSRRAKSVVNTVGKIVAPAKKVLSNPTANRAIIGTLKGLFYGSEVAKAMVIKANGGTWGDIVGTVGGDLAGMYAFEKGLTSAFATTRRSLVRKHFAKKNSRIFAGQTYKRSPVIKNDPNQERLTTTLLKKEEFPLEFKPTGPQAPKGYPKYDAFKLPQEVPTNDAMITGTINTKTKPRTTFKLETADNADDVLDVSKLLKKARNQAKQLTTSDEMRFLEQEKGLPEQLYTSDEKLWEELLKRDEPKAPKISSSGGAKGGQETVQLTKSTLKKVSISKTRASEATRAMKTKAEFYRTMREAQREIASAVNKLSDSSFGLGLVNLPGILEGPPKKIPAPPQQIQPPYWELDYNLEQLKKELVKQGQRQNTITGQKQETVIIPYWELDYDINLLKEQLRKQKTRDIQTQGQNESPTPVPPPNILPIEIQEQKPDVPPWQPPEPPRTKPKNEVPPFFPPGKLSRKPRKPRIKPPAIPAPFVGGTFVGSGEAEGPWIGWGRKNDTPLFTITPMRIPDPFSTKKRRVRNGIL